MCGAERKAQALLWTAGRSLPTMSVFLTRGGADGEAMRISADGLAEAAVARESSAAVLEWIHQFDVPVPPEGG